MPFHLSIDHSVQAVSHLNYFHGNSKMFNLNIVVRSKNCTSLHPLRFSLGRKPLGSRTIECEKSLVDSDVCMGYLFIYNSSIWGWKIYFLLFVGQQDKGASTSTLVFFFRVWGVTQVFQCNDVKVDRSSKLEFILRRMVSYFLNRSKIVTIRPTSTYLLRLKYDLGYCKIMTI